MSDSNSEQTSPSSITVTEALVIAAIIIYEAALFFFLVLPIIEEWFK